MASLSNVVNNILDLLLYGNEYLTPHMNHFILLAVLDTLKNHDDSLCETKIFKICAIIELNCPLSLIIHRIFVAVTDFIHAWLFC